MGFLLKTYLLLAALFSTLLIFETGQAFLFLSNIRLYLLAPALPLLLQCFRRRRWLPWLPVALAALLSFPWYLSRTPEYCASHASPLPSESYLATNTDEEGPSEKQPPKESRPAPTDAIVRVMTLNLAGSSMPATRDLFALVSQNDIQVLSLQEVSPGFWNTEGADLRRWLPHVAYRQDARGYWTQALLSKEPLTDIRFIDPGPGFSPEGARIIVQARWQGAGNLQFSAVHLSVPFRRGDCRGIPCLLSRYDQSDRDSQLRTLNAVQSGGPSLVLGDLNLSDQNPVYGSFLGKAMDAGACQTWNATWPADGTFPFPFLRIDYVLLYPVHRQPTRWRIRSYTLPVQGTDHLALISEIRVRKER
ncbi:MAG: endonuclease/exonuclease/phosphatase family protein [Leptospiraceae bacterium]|nr:endonuclease/exonuclease/phosphatase family protein [Leptospiraceae bacterium]